jgi:hypothetical protein
VLETLSGAGGRLITIVLLAVATAAATTSRLESKRASTVA